MVLNGRSEAGDVSDVSRGDGASVYHVDLAGGPETRGGDLMLADKVFVYTGYSNSTTIYKGRSSDPLSIE